MKLLITGANGMLGWDVSRVAESQSHEVVALSHDDLDITEGSAAGPIWDQLVRGHPEPAQAKLLETALREYCRRDTLGMVELVRTLAAPPTATPS